MEIFNLRDSLLVLISAVLIWGCQPPLEERQALGESVPAYRGIWYSNQPDTSIYRYKYSGGLATYPQQHIPIAIYREEVEKTFFVYGGALVDTNLLAYMVGYYDHKQNKVGLPTQISTKATDDAHDNPVLSIDDEGYLWVFANAHGIARPAYIYKSEKPYDTEAFIEVDSTNFSYAQPWFVEDHGFIWLRTQYQGNYMDRHLYYSMSENGETWTEPQKLAYIQSGDYQISWPHGNKLATAFDHHPDAFWGKEKRPDGYVGLNYRSNIYYAQTEDGGKTWTNVQGDPLALPLTEVDNPALALNTFKDKDLAYLKDLNFDAEGNPVILYTRSKGYEPGPGNAPRRWHILRWGGSAWQESEPIVISDNNYDHGSLYIEADGTWRIIAPVELGPQAYNPGGEMAMLISQDQGKTWETQPLTQGSAYNHTYARRPLNAHPDFYALWADGHAREPSPSRLYFCNQQGDVFQLPEFMDHTLVAPIKVELAVTN